MTENLKWQITSDSLDASQLLVDETLFHVANGYIGVRGNFEEGYPNHYNTIRGAYINGVYDISEVKHGEKLHGFIDSKQKIINITDVQGIKLYIAGEKFSLFDGKVLNFKRILDMREGIYKRQILWESPKGHIIEINIQRMASFIKPELFVIDYTVRSINYEGEIVFVSTQKGDVFNYFDPTDPRVAGELEKHLTVETIDIQKDIGIITSITNKSHIRVTSAVKHVVSSQHELERIQDDKSSTTKIRLYIKAGQAQRLVKYCIFTDSVRFSDCHQAAIDKMEEVLETPIEQLYQLQKVYLSAFWDKADVVVNGDDRLQQGIHFSLFELLQSVGKDQYSNIAAKGLSGEGYEGHYFWDTEIYMLPFFLLTDKALAENLLNYRYEKLEAARENARILGHKKGALYPWRTISGSECSAYFPSGTAQYHINADIAYMFVQYYFVTGDLDFVESKGAEVLFETARLWMDTGHYVEDSFRIDAVTGPDEYTCIVNNNYYTNCMAKYNLKWAVKFYELLKENNRIEHLAQKLGITEEEVNEWQQAAEKMYLPYDEKLDINPQDDSFLSKAIWDFENTPKDQYPLLLHYHPLYIYRYQVCKQADTVLAHFLLEDEQKLSTIKKSYEYYEKITTHDSSLSTCIFSIVAAKLGEIRKAYDYFMQTTRLDLDNIHHNTKDGIHTANMGGTYMGMVYGFAGLRIKESGIFFNPVIPEQWKSYEFKICYQGRMIKIHVNQEQSHYTLLEGKELKIHVYDQEYILNDDIIIKI
ncbi:glycoside hydrolase family 65 protein [Defluviitalea raffinosedens]|jgi:alpha,alpha-trehalose phosphorylase|uniref:Family 65 glycosyl hydrolase n=1 Tax=Defluviitalea raffinosedens TaxID=1450156 RepID=A0A7C8LCK7_9FIRM|nr:glycosyl hydrolase family 65 protein [Defluviitalea raffinosedens]KAE9632022.1 family 65 glycosyl hydrolase [Defluviitalea raffinosedens]MBM7686477.1 alpha,alpha-trehalose phosphorylase [Defluviitalea raffinosedens]HHW66392.1 glycoside hydrolase family 65 protein [Candidatus Epulonipiscium sp.]